jgi:hypothetical protein
MLGERAAAAPESALSAGRADPGGKTPPPLNQLPLEADTLLATLSCVAAAKA